MDGIVGEEGPSIENSYLSNIVAKVREDQGDFILLGFIALVCIVGYIEAQPLMRQSGLVPLIIIYLMAFVWVVTIVMKLFGESIRSKLGLSQTATGFQLDAEDTGEAAAEHIYDLNPKGVLKHFSWIGVYTLGLAYVGFWTTNILFPFIYIMLHETSPIPRRFVYFLLWTTLIVGTLWILFVELLLVQAIWRLGFLP